MSIVLLLDHVLLAKGQALAVDVDQRELIGHFLADNAGEHTAVAGGEGCRPITFDDLARGLEHRLDELFAVVLTADVRQIRADLAPLTASAMAPGAGQALEVGK